MIRKAPKRALKSMIHTKSKTTVKTRSTTDAMVELVMLVFLKNLADEARTKAFEEKSSTIRADHIKAVSKTMLKKSRG